MHRTNHIVASLAALQCPELVAGTGGVPLDNPCARLLRLLVDVDIEAALEAAYLVGVAGFDE